MQLTTIPLSRLVPSPLNVRKIGASDIAELAASIHAHGLLQNLTVVEHGEQFEVVAGGMRLRALQDLAKRKLVESDHLVPCNVVQAEEAHEASLTENVTRSAMHPADEFEAFAKLIADGVSPGGVATRFGKSELYVHQRMKLANVAPEILKEYRAGKATLEQLMALALTEDHDLQRRVWKAARADWQRRPGELRQVITRQEIGTDSPLGTFVGVEAYEKAGGSVRRDLFDEDGTAYMSDIELVRKLALEKLQRTVEKVSKEGWKWAEARIDFDYSEKSKFGRVYPNRKGSKEAWTDKDKAQAGVFVTIGHNGQTDIERGLVRPEDRRAAEKSSNGKVKGGKKVSDRKPGDLTFAAIQRLQAECGFVVAAHVAKHPSIAKALLAVELADKVFFSGYDGPRRWIYIARVFSGRSNRIAKEVEKSPAAQTFAQLEMDWRAKLPKKRSELRAWILAQSTDTIDMLIAFLVAREIDIVDNGAGQKHGIADLVAASGADLEKEWRPTREWLASLPKSTVIAMAKDAGGNAVALATLAKEPKEKFAARALMFFPSGWLPKPLRPAIEKKPAAKKAKRGAKA